MTFFFSETVNVDCQFMYFFVTFLASNSLGSFLFVLKQAAKKVSVKGLALFKKFLAYFPLWPYNFFGYTCRTITTLSISAFCLILIIIYFSITHSGSFFCNVAMASSLCFIPGVLTRWSFVSFLKNKI